jgi:tetratricopeptide (TPR) repeat protein
VQKGQIALVIGAVILALTLYFAGKTTSKKETVSEKAIAVSLSLDQYEVQQAEKLLSAEKSQHSALLSAIKAVKKEDTATLKKIYLETSEFWKKNGNLSLGSYYFYQFANLEATKTAFSSAGDVLINAYKNDADSTISNNLITFAVRSYENAVQKDSNDVELQIKLADVYVQGSQEPMKGIGILRDLSAKLPDNIPVLLALGRLSIQSGQYDKAKERLQKVLKLEPQNTEALYFLAITEAQLGHKEEAVRLFDMCKLLVNNKDFDKEIDDIVKSLK